MKNRGGLLTSMLQYVCYLNLLKDYTDGSLQSQYVGCYYDNSSQASWTVRVMNSSQMTIEFCIQTCKDSDTIFAIIQDGRNCLCGDVLNTSVPSNTCQIPCSGNMNEVCGGSNGTMIFNVVYTVCPVGYYGAGCNQVCHCKQYFPCYRVSGNCPIGCESNWTGDTCNKELNISNRYIGCYGDSGSDRAMIGYGDYPEANTIEYCSAICASNNATYIGLQYFSFCFCGESYEKYGTRTNCDTTCKGNSSQTCGGAFANSVYSVCPKGSYGKDCVAQCNCKNTDTCPYATGACNPGCIPGWSGTSCSDRNCSSQNGACSANETCITTNLTFSSVNRCQCSPGYQRTTLWDNCTDIDECNLGMCDQQTTTCNNSIGSFACNCLNGYKPGNNRTFCEEIPKAPLDNGKAGTIAGAVVGSILGFALIVAIVLLVLYLYRRRQPEKLVNHNQDLKELPGSSHENSIRNRALSLYAEGPNPYEVIGPIPGNALNTLLSKLSNPDSLKEEFQSVALQPKDFCALGTRDEVKKKNRFINIVPYESNRVTLSRTSDEDTSTYINASYVQGFNNATKFIAAQGPREETLEDFWRMIIENRVHLIVMITNLVENQKNKCDKYWPELGQPVVYGDITVTLKSEDSWPDYTVRCIQCSKKSETIELKQFHYLSWPDHGVPCDIKGFLKFRRIVRQHMKPDKYTVVHCSAGAGRTGAFIAIDYLLEQEKTEHDVRILDCLKKLRGQRSQMIQNLAQYVFVHNALLLAFEIGDTVIPIAQFLSKYKQLQTKEKSILEKQFQFLEQVTMESEETAKYRVWSNAVAQNKMNDMNAVFVQGWKLKDAYIATQPADPFTSLWELRQEHSCAVVIFLDPNRSSEAFFPTKDNPKSLSDCTLFCESITKEEYGSRYLVSELREQEDSTYSNVSSSDIYQNIGSTSAKTQVTVLHVTEFLGKGSWDAIRLMSMYDVIRSLTSKRNNAPVMVVSSDFSLSGFCLAAFNAFEMMKQEEMIDIYQIVLNIRKSRTELFNSMSSYIDLHNVVERYIAVSTA